MGDGVSKFDKRLVYKVVFVAFLFLIFYFFILQPSDVDQDLPENQLDTPRAAIVDHLSISRPNPEFIETSTSILTEAGFDVDYYEGGLVTVDFYRNLALHGYGLIILRVHSGINPDEHSTAFFTSEPYSTTEYVGEQLDDQVVRAIISISPSDDGPTYFAVNSKFVRSSMKGRFDNTFIITMGCDGLAYTDMAEALIDKEALVYIGWNRPVVANYVDRATLHLLQELITEEKTIGEAFLGTRENIGPDPYHGAKLVLYPISRQSERVHR